MRRLSGRSLTFVIAVGAALVGLLSGFYYYYANDFYVTNLNLTIDVNPGVDARISQTIGIVVQNYAGANPGAIPTHSCSLAAGGVSGSCEITIPNGGSVEVQIPMTFGSPGCAYPHFLVAHGSIDLSQDGGLAPAGVNPNCAQSGTFTYYILVTNTGTKSSDAGIRFGTTQ